MAQFTVNAQRFDPYKNFKFRVKWDGRYVAGISKVSGFKRTTEVVKHREGGDPSSSRKSPGRTEYDAILLERGVTHDTEDLLQVLRNAAELENHLLESIRERAIAEGFVFLSTLIEDRVRTSGPPWLAGAAVLERVENYLRSGIDFAYLQAAITDR